MTRPTLDSSAPARRRFGGWMRSHAAGRLVICALVGLALVACGGGSGGGSDGGAGTPDGGGTPVATEPVDLPPGQTEALIAWEPSQGVVTGYMVFLSRNGRFFQFDSVVDESRTLVQGAPGDVVRILVAAIGADDQTSSSSPPSVPIRFHADPTAPAGDEGGASLPPVGGGVPVPTPDPTPDPAPDPTPDPTPVAGPDDPTSTDPAPSDPTPTGDPNPTPGPDPEASPDAPVDATVLTSTLRTRLLTSGLKGTSAGLSVAARTWIAPWLSGEVPTDLDPIATAEGGTEGWRDVVWQDASGQLFVSAGEALAASDGPVSNLVPAIQRVASERFVALADLDGDGVRDWIVADDESGAATFRSDANAEPRPARAADQDPTTRLVGSGDFDGDGRIELLWQSEDGTLEWARPEGRLPALATGALSPTGYRIVAVADLDGDGRDDLIARAGDGSLAVGFAEVTSVGLGLAWSAGLAEAGVDSELVATLDLDDDGRAELVWLTNGSAEIRGLGETSARAF